jgi:biopolymer transport protein ExbD
MRKPKFKEKFTAEINIVPFTDVLLVLLVIFMVTTPLIIQGQIQVKLPKASTQSSMEILPVNLTLTADSRVFLDDQEVAWKDLAGFIKARLGNAPDKLVVVNADESVTHGVVVRLLDLAKGAGAQRLALATDQK